MSEKNFYLYVDGKPVKVSKDVYRECKHSEDKEQYFMKRLKKGRFVIDAEAQTVTHIPSREESYERQSDQAQTQRLPADIAGAASLAWVA